MEYIGVQVDRKTLKNIGNTIETRIDYLSGEIYAIAGEEFNIKSPSQLGVILFEKMRLTPGKKTKTGYSTNAEILEKIRGESPIIDKIMEYRKLTKTERDICGRFDSSDTKRRQDSFSLQSNGAKTLSSICE